MTDQLVPPVSGFQLIKLLQKDGWVTGRHATHGISIKKHVDGRWLVSVIPTKRDILPDGTISAILGSKQTRIGKKGLVALIGKYGLPKNSPP